MTSVYPSEEPPRSRERRAPMKSSPEYDDAYSRRPPPMRAPRESRHDSPRDPHRGGHRRRDDYDASDEDDPVPPRHSSRDVKSPRERPSGATESSLPRPPIGKDRPSYDDGVQPLRKPARHGHDGPPPSRERRRPPRDEELEPPRHKESSRGHGRDDDRRRSSGRHRRYDDEGDDYDPPPRRRSERDKPRDEYDDRGYRSEAPKRRPRDDHDRGYRTDGREARERERRREKDRSRGDDYDRRDRDHDRRRSSKKSPSKKPDLGQIMETGQKHWQKVEPVAKPMLAALAKKYLET